jgi:MFS family permease
MAVGNEETPLLTSDAASEDRIYRTQSKDVDANFVDFNTDHDPDNPQDWSPKYKWTVTALLAFMAFSTTFTCIGVVPVADRIVRDLTPDHTSNKSAAVLLVTIWELGEAAGPLLIGPLSEIHGRFRVLNVCNVLFVATTLMAALSQTTTLFITARALTGVSVVAKVLGPAIVADIFIPEQRGGAMSLIMLAPLTGGALGPAIAGTMSETWGWRSIVWLSALAMTICTVCVVLVYRETYKVVILRRRAAHLRETTGNASLRTRYDTGLESLTTSVLRPFVVYFHSPYIILISFFAGATFTWFYIMSTTLPEILEHLYHLSPAQIGSSFITFSVGSLTAVILCQLTLDRIYIYLRDRPLRKFEQEQRARPESAQSNARPPTIKNYPHHRLPPIILGALFMPIFICLYGLLPAGMSLKPGQDPAPLVLELGNVAIMGFFLLFSYLPVLPYITELAPLYAASAMTSVIVVRCLFGTFLPLAVGPMVQRYGWAKAFIGLAVVGVAMAGIPIGLWIWGEYRQGREERRAREQHEAEARG